MPSLLAVPAQPVMTLTLQIIGEEVFNDPAPLRADLVTHHMNECAMTHSSFLSCHGTPFAWHSASDDRVCKNDPVAQSLDFKHECRRAALGSGGCLRRNGTGQQTPWPRSHRMPAGMWIFVRGRYIHPRSDCCAAHGLKQDHRVL
jgi:hypothetical protein